MKITIKRLYNSISLWSHVILLEIVSTQDLHLSVSGLAIYVKLHERFWAIICFNSKICVFKKLFANFTSCNFYVFVIKKYSMCLRKKKLIARDQDRSLFLIFTGKLPYFHLLLIFYQQQTRRNQQCYRVHQTSTMKQTDLPCVSIGMNPRSKTIVVPTRNVRSKSTVVIHPALNFQSEVRIRSSTLLAIRLVTSTKNAHFKSQLKRSQVYLVIWNVFSYNGELINLDYVLALLSASQNGNIQININQL